MWPFEEVANVIQMILTFSCMVIVPILLRDSDSYLVPHLFSATMFCYFAGDLFWTLHILVLGASPECFSASDIAWLAYFLFFSECCKAMAGTQRSRLPWWVWILPVAIIANVGVLAFLYGGLIVNLVWGVCMALLAFYAGRGLAGGTRWSAFYATVLGMLVVLGVQYQSWGILYSALDLVIDCLLIVLTFLFVKGYREVKR